MSCFMSGVALRVWSVKRTSSLFPLCAVRIPREELTTPRTPPSKKPAMSLPVPPCAP